MYNILFLDTKYIIYFPRMYFCCPGQLFHQATVRLCVSHAVASSQFLKPIIFLPTSEPLPKWVLLSGMLVLTLPSQLQLCLLSPDQMGAPLTFLEFMARVQIEVHIL